MIQKDIHVVQPYRIGSSMVFVIPSRIVKEQNFNTSTVFAMRIVDTTKIMLKVIDTRYKVKEKQKENMMMIAEDYKSFEASGSQQISSSPFLSRGVR